ncbi:hypothetical protein C1T17_07965 [Sphingobium sp. SCG-1]|nr:hypothetical protein C1T17_07965 [Sphingobium sp. SCG-1]
MGSALSAAFIASIGIASPAYALDAKQCLPMSEMNAALKAEGQRTLVIGDREAIQNPTGKIKDASVLRFVNTVTSNADGSLGYQLEGDLPRAQASHQVCVAAKLTNVRLFDARRPGVPQEALLGGKFDEAIREIEKLGTRPMVVADTVHTGADGQSRQGLPIVLLANVEHKGGHLFTRLANGQPQFLMQMGDTEYTPAGLARLNPQVAMVSPK